MSVNKVILLGRAGQDAQVRMVGENKVATFSLATTEKYKDSKTNEWKENTEWHNIVAWRHTADIAEKYITKGKEIYIEGKLRTRSWEDQSGNKKYVTEIVAETVQLLGKPEGHAAPQPATSYAPQPQRQQSKPLPPMGDPDDSDLPF